MLLAAVLTALMASSLAEVPPKCGKISNKLLAKMEKMTIKGTTRTRRIIGGSTMSSQDAPWIVRVDINRNHICTGSLISEDTVVTAGHCFVHKRPDNTCVKISDINKYSACMHTTDNNRACANPIGIKDVLNWDNYVFNNCSLAYDFVVLKLKTSIRGIVPVCLPIPSNGIRANHPYNQRTYMFGYSDNVDGSTNKIGNTQLKVTYSGSPLFYKSKYIFKIRHYNKQIAICSGDSGGPLIEVHNGKAVLIGVNSNSEWNCDVDTIYFLPDPKVPNDHVLYSVSLQHRLQDREKDVWIFPQF